jgi:hypothetical protein
VLHGRSAAADLPSNNLKAEYLKASFDEIQTNMEVSKGISRRVLE